VARPSSRRELDVWMNGERVGTWTSHPGRPDEFQYAQQWLATPEARPLSLSMVLQPEPFKGPRVSAFFDNLLPDNQRIRQRLQRRFETATIGAFDLLTEIGRDCVGAIQLLPRDSAPPDVRTITAEPLSASLISQHLSAMLRALPGSQTEDDDFRISIAGAQEKTALLRIDGQWMRAMGTTPSTHLLKLPLGAGGGGIDLTTSVENEWLCAQILNAYGIPTAHCWMDQFEEQRVLVVERFDRRLSRDNSWIIRLPQEDMCQAAGLPSDQKYEVDGGPGIRAIMDLLLGSSKALEDRRDFFKTQILFWMLCAIDGHAKNFSIFLESSGSYRLTPRYDVLSAYPVLGTSAGKLSPRKVKMAMAVDGKNRHYLWDSILYRHWEETARRTGMSSVFKILIQELVDSTSPAIDTVTALIPKGFPDAVATSILEGLRGAGTRLSTQIA
jgi:serine/threonine-protein kinase HipA